MCVDVMQWVRCGSFSLCNMKSGRERDESLCQGGVGVLLMMPAADGKKLFLQPVTFSAERMIRCSLPLAVAEAYQMVMEEVRMDWWRCRSAPSLTLAGWISSAAAGRASPAVLFWGHLRSWVMMVPRKRKDSTVSTGWWGWVGLGSSYSPQSSLLSLEDWAPGCSDCTKSWDGQSPTCRRTHAHQRGWCCPQTSVAWWTDDWRCICWCTGRRAEWKERSFEGNRCGPQTGSWHRCWRMKWTAMFTASSTDLLGTCVKMLSPCRLLREAADSWDGTPPRRPESWPTCWSSASPSPPPRATSLPDHPGKTLLSLWYWTWCCSICYLKYWRFLIAKVEFHHTHNYHILISFKPFMLQCKQWRKTVL